MIPPSHPDRILDNHHTPTAKTYTAKASTTVRALQSSNTHITRQKQQLTVNISSTSIKKMFERNHSNRTEKKHKKFFVAKSDGK
jgi:hypothetical protein